MAPDASAERMPILYATIVTSLRTVKKKKISISAEEIALIKAMQRRGLAFTRIQAYFSHPNRLVNSFRLAEIRDGVLGADVEAASDEGLDEFLLAYEKARSGIDAAAITASQKAGQEHLDAVRALFEERKGGWFFIGEETDDRECKENFNIRHLGKVLRARAALANNKGGRILFGVRDSDKLVTGIKADAWDTLDPADISQRVTSAIQPVPEYRRFRVELGHVSVGVLEVSRSSVRPAIAIKNDGDSFAEGTIYYRYVGESKAAKPGEIEQMIRERERYAVQAAAAMIAKRAAGEVAILDLDTGVADGPVASFIIDEDLLNKVQFVREGQFVEKDGAPSLKLVGEVRPIGARHIVEERERIVREAISDADVARNFLEQSPVEFPYEYIRHLLHTQRRWLPVFYYAKLSGLSVDALADKLALEPAGYPANRTALFERLRGELSAFQSPSAQVLSIAQKIESGTIPTLSTPSDVMAAARAVAGLRSADFGQVSALLSQCLLKTQGGDDRSKAIRSMIYRAVCRLDEIAFATKIGAA